MRGRFRLRCPRRLFRLWRDTVELARRIAGGQLTEGHAAEAIAAEGLSARPSTAEPWPEALWSTDAPPADPAETRAAFAPDLDWGALAEVLPADVEALGTGLDDLDPFLLDARMRAVLEAMQKIDWQMGRLLRVFLDRRLHRVMRFPSAARWARERLGISARKVRALVALERKTWEVPAFGDAYRTGVLSSVRALALLPVVQEETAPAWVARARQVTVRRLTDEVEWALAARDGYQPIVRPTGAVQRTWRTIGEGPRSGVPSPWGERAANFAYLPRAGRHALTPDAAPPHSRCQSGPESHAERGHSDIAPACAHFPLDPYSVLA